MWHHLFYSDISLTEKIVRTLAVYAFLLVGLRLAGKRELGQLNPFDLVVLLLLSNTLQNAIIGKDDTVLGGLVGATVLLVVNWLAVRYLYEHPALDEFLTGRSDVLVRNGRVINKHLRRELITRDELEAAARRQGLESLSDVHTCRLEVGGALSFTEKKPSDDERRHREVMARLASLADAQAGVVSRLAALERRAP
jgi:uncharacterized membrane protein YcaP (DUF421 family)